MTKSVQVVVPIFNEVDILDELHARLTATLGTVPHAWGITYVDDGSRDGSSETIARLCDGDRRVGAIHLSRNFGQQLAIAAGLAAADGDAVILMDGDLQDPPEIIPRLIEQWEAGFDVVYAIKKHRKEGVIKRALFASFYRVLRFLSPLEIPPNAGNFSLMDRRVVDVINAMPERSRYVSGLRAYVGGRQIGVEFERAERFAGEPRQSPRRLAKMAADALFAFSEAPLRAATALGFLVSGVAFLVMVNVLYQKLVSGEAILGWASVMTSILFLGGIQLVALGIIGEYIGRIYAESKGRPMYVISAARRRDPQGASIGTGPRRETPAGASGASPGS